MKSPADKSPEPQRQAAAHDAPQQQECSEAEFQFVDNRAETASLRQLQAAADNSPRTQGLSQLKSMMNSSPRSGAMQSLQATVDNIPRRASMGLQAGSDDALVQRVEDEEVLQGEFAVESPAQLAHLGAVIQLGPGKSRGKKRRSSRQAQKKAKLWEIDPKNVTKGRRRRSAPVKLMVGKGKGMGYPHQIRMKKHLRAKYNRNMLRAQKTKHHLPQVDFNSYVHNNMQCKISYTGYRKKDYKIAEDKFKFTHQAKVHVWHHVADYQAGYGTLQLLPYDIHSAHKHRGGVEQAISSGDFYWYG